MLYDVIVIGGGPAGLTAAIYAVRKKLKVLVLGGSLGGQAALSGEIANYLGFSLIQGPELVLKFREHVKTYKDIDLKEGVRANEIQQTEHAFNVKADSGDTFETKTVILSMGQKPRELKVPGEHEFKNKGLTYCATCDGPLFHGKDVAVVGGGNSGLEAALELSGIAKKVYLIQNMEVLTGDAILVKNLQKKKNVEVLLNTTVQEVRGSSVVSGLVVHGHETQTLDVQGVFVEIGWVPSSELAKDLVQVNKHNEIMIDKDTQTSVPGIFACGDVTNVHSKQIIIAAGEGAKAAISAFKYIINRHDYE